MAMSQLRGIATVYGDTRRCQTTMSHKSDPIIHQISSTKVVGGSITTSLWPELSCPIDVEIARSIDLTRARGGGICLTGCLRPFDGMAHNLSYLSLLYRYDDHNLDAVTVKAHLPPGLCGIVSSEPRSNLSPTDPAYRVGSLSASNSTFRPGPCERRLDQGR
jgi:hypothetical protein